MDSPFLLTQKPLLVEKQSHFLHSSQLKRREPDSIIVPFHNDVPLAVSSLNNVNKLIHYNNQLTVVEQYFTMIAIIQNMGPVVL